MSEKVLLSPALADLRDGDEFEGFYVVRESSFQTAINGKNYIRMILGDSSASLMANLWDANRDLYQLCPSGCVIKVAGVAESYKGKRQARLLRFRPAHDSEVNLDSFLPKSKYDPDDMRKELLGFVNSLVDPDYLALGEAFFKDKVLTDAFCRAPAAREVHHAYLGGLIEHTLNIARMAEAFSQRARVNRDLLLLGALLHDVGKTEELTAKYSIEYSNRGKLLGHLFIGAEMTGARAEALPGFPAEKLNLVQHLILSHHGRYEYGSPVLPKIPEAFALHHLDNLDAKVETANRLLDAVTDPDKSWTDFSRALDTQLYREDNRERENEDA